MLVSATEKARLAYQRLPAKERRRRVAQSILWRQENRERWNAKRHRTVTTQRFNITNAMYDALYRDPSCGGCGARCSQGGRRLCVDHDHITDRIRGLLCHDCNRTISTVHDNPATLRALARYLEE